ncbi:MAG: DMT family transporter, partial [Longimicrobiales bacterium]
RELGGVQPLVTATGGQIAATLLLLPLCVIYWPSVTPSLFSWLCAIALGIACTGIAYVLYFRLISRVGPAKAITVTYLVPVFGMLWGLVFLHEAITPSMIVACAVILLGTGMATGNVALVARSRPSLGPSSHRAPCPSTDA